MRFLAELEKLEISRADMMIYIGDGRRRLTSYINRFSTDLKGLFAVGSAPGRFCVTSIEFGGPFVRVLRRKVHLGSTAGGQVEFHDKPKFYSSRLCTVKHVSRGGFGTAGGQK